MARRLGVARRVAMVGIGLAATAWLLRVLLSVAAVAKRDAISMSITSKNRNSACRKCLSLAVDPIRVGDM